jgi:hypothetical protein
MREFNFPMDQAMREQAAKFIERYRLIEEKGQFSYWIGNYQCVLENFAHPDGAIHRMQQYYKMREDIQYILTRIREAIADDDRKKFLKWYDKLAEPYGQFMHFCLKSGADDKFFDELQRQMGLLDGPHYLELLLDTLGIADYAVAFGTWLLKELIQMIDHKDIEGLTMFGHRFPGVMVKVVNSREEGEAWVKEMVTKMEQEEKGSELDLSRMNPIGSA